MASLKEVKTRIESVENTRKITQARQKISSAYLHRSQEKFKNVSAYMDAMEEMAAKLSDPSHPYESAVTMGCDDGGVAVVIMSSNSGMCGSFNARVIKEINKFKELHAGRRIVFYPIGKKVRLALQKNGLEICGNFDHLADKPLFSEVEKLTGELIAVFSSDQITRVELIYTQYKSISSLNVRTELFLPYVEPKSLDVVADVILEPSGKKLLDKIVPALLNARLYSTIIENQTAEHAARTVAMQAASENANELLDGLRLTYNKLRQQSITTELLDIIGSSFA